MTVHLDDADLRELLHSAAPAGVDPLDHGRLQARGRRRRAARRAVATTAGLGTVVALLVAAPLVLPSTPAPVLTDTERPADPDSTAADDDQPLELGPGCPGAPTTNFACLPSEDRPDAPDLDLDLLDDGVEGPTDLTTLQGRTVVLTVWGADWCGPCAAQQSDLNLSFADATDVAFIGIATSTLAEDAVPFVDAHRVDYPTLLDLDGSYVDSLNRTIERDHAGIPATYLIDRDGRIAAWFIGQTDRDQLDAAIEHIADQ